jgi:menaquinone-dependent protoporphyrinogen oxidase
MKVVVVAAGRHGSTDEIGRVIAATLRKTGVEVDVSSPGDVDDIGGYDAAIVGSAIYLGKWVKAVRLFVAKHERELAGMTVWLFSVVPAGVAPATAHAPADIAGMQARLHPRRHAVFAGWRAPGGPSRSERALVKLRHVRGPDYRRRPEIVDFARTIAEELAAPQRVSAPGSPAPSPG